MFHMRPAQPQTAAQAGDRENIILQAIFFGGFALLAVLGVIFATPLFVQ